MNFEFIPHYSSICLESIQWNVAQNTFCLMIESWRFQFYGCIISFCRLPILYTNVTILWFTPEWKSRGGKEGRIKMYKSQNQQKSEFGQLMSYDTFKCWWGSSEQWAWALSNLSVYMYICRASAQAQTKKQKLWIS